MPFWEHNTEVRLEPDSPLPCFFASIYHAVLYQHNIASGKKAKSSDIQLSRTEGKTYSTEVEPGIVVHIHHF